MEHEKLFTPQSIKKLREKQVQMAWSLLNLDKSTNDIVLLSKILIAISSYKNLFCHEVEFINYLWQNWGNLNIVLYANLNYICSFLSRSTTSRSTIDFNPIRKLSLYI